MLSIPPEKCLKEPKHLSAYKKNDWKSREVPIIAENCSEGLKSDQQRGKMLGKGKCDQHRRKMISRPEKGLNIAENKCFGIAEKALDIAEKCLE